MFNNHSGAVKDVTMGNTTMVSKHPNQYEVNHSEHWTNATIQRKFVNNHGYTYKMWSMKQNTNSAKKCVKTMFKHCKCPIHHFHCVNRAIILHHQKFHQTLDQPPIKPLCATKKFTWTMFEHLSCWIHHSHHVDHTIISCH